MTRASEEKPFLIAIGGFSGSGKTSVAAALQKNLPDTVHLDSDRTRKRIFGVAETMPLPPDAYTPEATRGVIAETERQVKEHIATGRNVVISATFTPAPSRVAVEALAHAVEARFVGIWLQADLSVLFVRVKKRVGDASDAGVEVVKSQMENETETVAWPMVDATLAPEAIMAAVLRMIEG